MSEISIPWDRFLLAKKETQNPNTSRLTYISYIYIYMCIYRPIILNVLSLSPCQIAPLISHCFHFYSEYLCLLLCLWRPHELGSCDPRWLREARSHGLAQGGAPVQSFRASGAKIPLAEGQQTAGAGHALQAERDWSADRKSTAQRLGQLRVRSVEQLRKRRGHRAPSGQRYVLFVMHRWIRRYTKKLFRTPFLCAMPVMLIQDELNFTGVKCEQIANCARGRSTANHRTRDV